MNGKMIQNSTNYVNSTNGWMSYEMSCLILCYSCYWNYETMNYDCLTNESLIEKMNYDWMSYAKNLNANWSCESSIDYLNCENLTNGSWMSANCLVSNYGNCWNESCLNETTTNVMSLPNCLKNANYYCASLSCETMNYANLILSYLNCGSTNCETNCCANLKNESLKLSSKSCENYYYDLSWNDCYCYASLIPNYYYGWTSCDLNYSKLP